MPTHPFIVISDDAIFLKQVLNTNKCIIQLEKIGNKTCDSFNHDNLLKVLRASSAEHEPYVRN